MHSYDVVVIGGGIHGVGAAQAAAAAGYSTLLLEQEAWASGTSSRSSKLIHGGLRYLATAQIGLVRESLRERETLLRIAPDLVRRSWFYMPIYESSHYRPWQVRAGLTAYSILGGLKSHTQFESVKQDKWAELSGLSTEGLQQVFRYPDAQTDDRLLTLAVLTSARKLGATTLCPAQFVSAARQHNGYRIIYNCEGAELSCECKLLINAGGPWVNQVLTHIAPVPKYHEIDLVQGAHLVLEGQLSRHCFYLESTPDQRMVFVMPWQGDTLLGTTETLYQGAPSEVKPLADEQVYLMNLLSRYFPQLKPKVKHAFAGLRVLPRTNSTAFNRPRDVELLCDDKRNPHLISVYGGKLTGYRATGEKLVKLMRRTLGRKPPIADTAEMHLERPL